MESADIAVSSLTPDSELYFMHSIAEMTLLVLDWHSFHFHAQCPRCVPVPMCAPLGVLVLMWGMVRCIEMVSGKSIAQSVLFKGCVI